MCSCKSGWTGAKCDCKPGDQGNVTQCVNPRVRSRNRVPMCSNRGTCQCGRCKCEDLVSSKLITRQINTEISRLLSHTQSSFYYFIGQLSWLKWTDHSRVQFNLDIIRPSARRFNYNLLFIPCSNCLVHVYNIINAVQLELAS